MASWPVVSTWRIRSDAALAPVAPGVFLIASGTLNNLTAVPIDLDASRLHLQVQAPSWVSMSTWCVRFINALVSDAFRTFLDALDAAWHERFAARLVWLVSRSTW